MAQAPQDQPCRDDAYASFLTTRRKAILARVRAACERVGRDESDVSIVAVSKTVDVAAVRAAMDAGYRRFGENRPQELARKLEALGADGGEVPPFDLIGNLQRNKVNLVLGKAQLIQSVSSLALAEAVSSRAEARGIVQPVLFEVNVSGEATKGGFAPLELEQAAERLVELPGIEPRGLMTMAPAHAPDLARQTFKGLRELRATLIDQCGLQVPELSCGMSDDFTIAIEEGSTIVRLGRVVFDQGYELAGD